MIRTLLACALPAIIITGGILYAQTPSWDWADRAGGASSVHGAKIVSDGRGGIYVAGTFRDSATFGEHTLISYGNTDVFLARYTSGGICLWAVAIGSAEDNIFGGLAVDSDGFPRVCGTFVGTVNARSEYPDM